MTGCVETRKWQVEQFPWDAEALASARRVRVLRTGGDEVELTEAELVEGAPSVLRGRTSKQESALIEIPVDDIRQVETSSTKPLTGIFRAISGTGLLFVTVAVIGLLVLADGEFEFR